MKKEKKPKSGLARLMQLAGKRKAQMSVACVLSVLAAGARLVPFFTIYGVLREIISNYNNLPEISTQTIWWLVCATAISALVYGVCSFASGVTSHKAAYNILFELRVQLMEKLSRLPSGYFTKTTKGTLKKVVQDDVEKVEEFIAHNIADTAAAVALPMFTIIYLFIMDWRLALATILPLFVAVGLLSVGLKNPKGAQTQVDMHQTREKMNSTIVEYVHGMQVIKVFNRTMDAFARLGESINNYASAVEKATYFFAPSMGAYYVAMGAQLLFVLPAGLVLILNSSSYIDFLPLLLLFFLVGTGLKEPLENMMAMALSTNDVAIGVLRIDEILIQNEVEEPSSPKTPNQYDICFDKVGFSYNENGVQAVNNVSFTLAQNSITGLVGPSGGGKSTIAQLLLRFYEPQEGCIKIGGVDIRDISQSKLMEMIAYVFQDSVLFNDTIENNIRMGNQKPSRTEIENAAKSAGIHDVISRLPQGYNTVIGKENAYLSGGEKQRIAIARVFLKNSPIIILDEATAYADAENEALIQESFAKLAEGKTVIIIAHRLKTVENADNILVMKQGKLVGANNHKTLMGESEAYAQMVQANECRNTWSIRANPGKEVGANAQI